MIKFLLALLLLGGCSPSTVDVMFYCDGIVRTIKVEGYFSESIMLEKALSCD